MERYFLGIDIGTFESRGILIDESFRVVADASVPHGMDNPQPGWFEQDAKAVWWGDLCKLCRTLIKQSEIRPEQIACVGTSALGTDCLPVDEQCLSLIHISEPTRRTPISYAVFCLKKKNIPLSLIHGKHSPIVNEFYK